MVINCLQIPHALQSILYQDFVYYQPIMEYVTYAPQDISLTYNFLVQLMNKEYVKYKIVIHVIKQIYVINVLLNINLIIIHVVLCHV